MVDEQVDSISLPTQMGEITVLENHIPLVANLVPGEIVYRKGGESKYFAVSGGFIEINKDNRVVILADTAEFGHEIDIDRAMKAREEAKKMMQESYHDETAFAEASAAMEKSLARIKVAKKHHTHTSHNLESGTLSD